MKKKSLPRGFYALTFILLFIVVTLASLPLVVPSAKALYEPSTLTVMFALLSLVVSLVVFGLLGDSEALIKSGNESGFSVQLTGAAAGFVVFFYLLTKGLSPYAELTVYLYKGQDRLLEEGDGPVDVALAGNVMRSARAVNGQVTFAYLPKAEDRRILISGSGWSLKSVVPSDCLTGQGRLVSTCRLVELSVEKTKVCLSDIRTVQTDPQPVNTDMDTVLKRLKERVQPPNPDLQVTLDFSAEVLEAKIHRVKFDLQRKDTTERSICSHLSDLEGWFNRFNNAKVVKISTSCSGILIQKSNEPLIEGFSPCTR